VLKVGMAEPHRFVHYETGWVMFRIRSEEDTETVKELICHAYDKADKMMHACMSTRVQRSN